ncbi:hypothetical protein HMPREF9296_1815 [Prevotella disiens FB035-09AN]|uniref:Uncharacterized protein n=1 Tax=Prevotella disiens FB035-09AN TaxID=866771 RepID=E1KTK4_9BACT|nr:hypothetical protein HMPREF9296_1815 [Prevotella disiens FB035-09AN]
MSIVAKEYYLWRFIQHRFRLHCTTRTVKFRTYTLDVLADFVYPFFIQFLFVHSQLLSLYPVRSALKKLVLVLIMQKRELAMSTF